MCVYVDLTERWLIRTDLKSVAGGGGEYQYAKWMCVPA